MRRGGGRTGLDERGTECCWVKRLLLLWWRRRGGGEGRLLYDHHQAFTAWAFLLCVNVMMREMGE